MNGIHIYRLEGGKAVEHRAGRDDLGTAVRQLGVIADAVPSLGRAASPRAKKSERDVKDWFPP